VPDGGILYTVSQDATIKAVNAASLETIAAARKAVRGMARILGARGETLIVADSGRLSLWDKRSLAFLEMFDFPTGSFNKGALLYGDTLYGSDYECVYSMDLSGAV
jgi:hypothetical protein